MSKSPRLNPAERVALWWSDPRLVQDYLMSPPESRDKVAAQIRALHELTMAEPDLAMIPSHDERHLDALIEAGLIKRTFVIDAP